MRGSIPIPPQVMRPGLLQCCERRLSDEHILDNVRNAPSFIFSFTTDHMVMMVWAWDADQRIHVCPFLYVHICVGIDVYAWCWMLGHETTAGTPNFTLLRLVHKLTLRCVPPALPPKSPPNRTPHSHDAFNCDYYRPAYAMRSSLTATT